MSLIPHEESDRPSLGDSTAGGSPTERMTVDLSSTTPSTGANDLGMRIAPPFDSTIIVPGSPPEANGSHPAVMLSGNEFGNYEILGEIGRGGMGVVYKARQKGLDRIVAIKMILSSHLASPVQVERFYAEARAAAKLRDPHIVGIHDVGELSGQHYFVMEYVAGPSLAHVSAEGPVPAEQAARLVVAIAEAVGRVHSRGIVHRDLKPSNVLLDADERPRVTDFGLAKMLRAEGPHTQSGSIVGTPSYMAPEQAAGRGGEVGPLSDVYSLGAILYELLTGRPPFDEYNPLDTLVQVLEAEPSPPSRLNAKVPRELELICLKCLEKTPSARYASAFALAKDLQQYLRGEQVEASRLGPWQRIRRWTRREPALVSRLCTFVIGASVVQVDQYLVGSEIGLHRKIMVVLSLGAMAAITFQWLLSRERWSNRARYAWALADMILFTNLIVITDSLNSPLVAGYFLLVAASGLWFRERLVWFTTLLAVGSYGVCVLEAVWRRSATLGAHRHLMFVVVLVLSGLIVAYQVKRVRALSHYYEHRPLP